jgi:hypothetical protein
VGAKTVVSTTVGSGSVLSRVVGSDVDDSAVDDSAVDDPGVDEELVVVLGASTVIGAPDETDDVARAVPADVSGAVVAEDGVILGEAAPTTLQAAASAAIDAMAAAARTARIFTGTSLPGRTFGGGARVRRAWRAGQYAGGVGGMADEGSGRWSRAGSTSVR